MTVSHVKAVLFDAAGTLLTPRPSVGHVYTSLAAEFGVQADPDAVDKAFRRAWIHHTTIDSSPPPFDQPDTVQYWWWREIVVAAYSETGQYEDFGTRFDAYFDALYWRFAQPNAWHLFEDAETTMAKLAARGISMAVVSNWDGRLPRLIASTPLSQYLAFVLTSSEAASRKPDSGIFREALRRLGMSEDDVIHVGDSPVEDIVGAQGAGIKALLIHRGAPPKPDEAIASLSDVLNFLD